LTIGVEETNKKPVRSLVAVAVAVALGAAPAGGCGREPRREGPPAAVATRAPSLVDTTRAARDPDELLRAFATSRRALGAHRLHGKSSLQVTEGGATVEDLYEEALVERAANGDLHASYENSRDQGREIVASAGLVWLRPRFGKFHRRPPVDPGEAERVADEIGGSLAAGFDLVAGQAALGDGGAVTIAGRPARRVRLAVGPARPRAAHEGWRDGARVESLDGEIQIDDATGAVLGGRLDAKVAFAQGQRRLALAFHATEEASDLGGAVVVTPPADADSVDTPGRAPDFDDREELLGGLAPSARRGASK